MNALISRCLPSRLLPHLAAAFGCVALGGCNSSKNNAAPPGSNGAYATYPADGRYNPYPAGSQTTAPRYQEYTDTPPAPSASKPKSGSTSSGTSTSTSNHSAAPVKKTTKKKSSTTASTKSTGSGTIYVVKPKDSLWSIAKKYHTTVSKLKSANGLTSDVIRDGKKLKIP